MASWLKIPCNLEGVQGALETPNFRISPNSQFSLFPFQLNGKEGRTCSFFKPLWHHRRQALYFSRCILVKRSTKCFPFPFFFSKFCRAYINDEHFFPFHNDPSFRWRQFRTTRWPFASLPRFGPLWRSKKTSTKRSIVRLSRLVGR